MLQTRTSVLLRARQSGPRHSREHPEKLSLWPQPSTWVTTAPRCSGGAVHDFWTCPATQPGPAAGAAPPDRHRQLRICASSDSNRAVPSRPAWSRSSPSRSPGPSAAPCARPAPRRSLPGPVDLTGVPAGQLVIMLKLTHPALQLLVLDHRHTVALKTCNPFESVKCP